MQGLRGRLLTASFVADVLPSLTGNAVVPVAFVRALDAWAERTTAALGPASSVRVIADVSLVPLLRILDLSVISRTDEAKSTVVHTAFDGHGGPAAVVIGWKEPLSQAWRGSVLHAIAGDSRWALCTNGAALRIVDARRTWSRDYLEIDLALAARDPGCALVLWLLLRGQAITAQPPLLDRATDLSARHGDDVCRSLGRGAVEALTLLVESVSPTTTPRDRAAAAVTRRTRRDDPRLVFEHSITVLYRVLFLLFAEARGLVPMWHPVYRDRYSIDAIVTGILENMPAGGLWHAIQAISRLAHAGCSAGELRVNAFNGRLFSATESASFDRRPLPDAVMARAITAVSTRMTGPAGTRRRISYRDLDVEQLGAVYEQVLEYAPGAEGADWSRSRDHRKATGTFYTPREVTAFLVRRTLGPLAEGRSSSDILRLRVIDPAMGSGAFLVAACRYLASALEQALVREGRLDPADITPSDHAALRRQVAAQCLFGIDINPMAVQLARLSLWLTTLSADKPLSFLDHHLVAGDSLVGTTPADIRRRPSRVATRARRSEPLPLFGDEDLAPTIETAALTRMRLSLEPDDTPAIVREKERTLAALSGRDSPLARWSRLLDLWCAGWFWTGDAPPDRAVFSALADHILHERSSLPSATIAPLLSTSETIAARRRFIHWPLAFPEVFSDEHGMPSSDPGFDALLGNPPWDMVRGDSGTREVRTSRRGDAQRLASFVRESGVYSVESRAHVNRYQLFVERALQVVRRGGRIGLVLPSGIASDTGNAPLRRYLFDRSDVDSIIGLDNRAAIFPIHRSVRFALLTCTTGRPTTRIDCRFGISDPTHLDRADTQAVPISRRLLTRVSGDDDLGIPEIASERDLRIVERCHERAPWLGSADGWQAKFGRELNATDDRDKFRPITGDGAARPIVEGKLLEPFRVSLDECRLELRPDAAESARVQRMARIAYRDVASATNRLTLIAAIVPAQAITTHTLFCLKSRMRVEEQHVLCAILNSFVANYLVRLRVTTHVTVTLVSRLPVPLVRPDHPLFPRILALARALAGSRLEIEEMPEYAELQAHVACLYGLTVSEYEHVLSTFPLVEADVRARSLVLFARLSA